MERIRTFSGLFHLPTGHRKLDARAVESRIPYLDPRIMEQIHLYAEAGFGKEKEVGQLTREEYVRDMVYGLSKSIKHPTEKEIQRMLVVDPRVKLEKQLELFEIPHPDLNPACVVNRSNIPEETSTPYTVILCDLPYHCVPGERYSLYDLAHWITGFHMRGLTAMEGLIYLKLHPEFAREHVSHYFIGSEYGTGKFVMQTTNHLDQLELRSELASVERRRDQVPITTI